MVPNLGECPFTPPWRIRVVSMLCLRRKGRTEVAETLTVNPYLLPISVGGSAKVLFRVLGSAVSSFEARIDEDKASDGINIERNLESPAMLEDLLASKRAESMLPSLAEL